MVLYLQWLQHPNAKFGLDFGLTIRFVDPKQIVVYIEHIRAIADM